MLLLWAGQFRNGVDWQHCLQRGHLQRKLSRSDDQGNQTNLHKEVGSKREGQPGWGPLLLAG